MVLNLAGRRIWGSGSLGQPMSEESVLTQQEATTLTQGQSLAGSLRRCLGWWQSPSWWLGENSGRGCHGCPGPRAVPKQGQRCGQRGHLWSPVEQHPHTGLAPLLELSQQLLQLPEHGSKEVAMGCPLGTPASRPTERRGASHPNRIPLLERLPSSSPRM